VKLPFGEMKEILKAGNRKVVTEVLPIERVMGLQRGDSPAWESDFFSHSGCNGQGTAWKSETSKDRGIRGGT